MFCKQFLAYAVHNDWCYHSIHNDIGDVSSSFRGLAHSLICKLHIIFLLFYAFQFIVSVTDISVSSAFDALGLN